MSLMVESNGYSAIFSHTLIISSLLRSTPVEERGEVDNWFSEAVPGWLQSEAAGTYRAYGP